MTYRLVSRVTGRILGEGSYPECRAALQTLIRAPLYPAGSLDIQPCPEQGACARLPGPTAVP